ncbi:MAG TPA: hypothetical protein VGF43_20190 [Dongiaceae bacterium]
MQVTLIAGGRSQPVDKAGFKSLTPRLPLRTVSIAPAYRDCSRAADLAWRRAGMAGQAHWLDWIETSLRRSGVALTARLPHRDALTLAWIAATGTMTWPEINVALDATIKRAVSEQLAGMAQHLDGSRDARTVHDAWQEARSNGETEIWGRYHAQCDAFFAEESAPVGKGPAAIEQVLKSEQHLAAFRSARDDALADLDRRLGPAPPQPASSGARNRPYQIAVRRFRLAVSEIELLRRLRMAGFIGSRQLMQVVSTLATEVTAGIARVAGCDDDELAE